MVHLTHTHWSGLIVLPPPIGGGPTNPITPPEMTTPTPTTPVHGDSKTRRAQEAMREGYAERERSSIVRRVASALLIARPHLWSPAPGPDSFHLRSFSRRRCGPWVMVNRESVNDHH